jgi:serine/threonine protein kinase
MAEVFKAVKTGPDGFEKVIALKRILPFYTDHPQFIKMLSLEARIHSKLSHPNIVQLYDFFQWDQQYIIAMEYVDGCNGKQLIQNAQNQQYTLPWQACVFMACEVLKALHYAHRKKDDKGPLDIVHRDISPHNILIAYDGRVKLSDFGIANAQMKEDKTKSGVLKGKYRYLSPEQVTAEDITPQSDLFSLGVTLYEMLAGQHPFSQDKEFELLKSIVRGDCPDLKKFRPDLPTPLYGVVQQAMMPENEDRYQQARDFLDDLIALQEPSWLSYGEEKLGEMMVQLIPPDQRLEIPIEKTKVMGETTAGSSLSISEEKSLIAHTHSLEAFQNTNSASTPMYKRQGLIGFVVVMFCLLAGIGWYVWKPSTVEPNQVIQTPSAAPVSTTAPEQEQTPTVFKAVPIDTAQNTDVAPSKVKSTPSPKPTPTAKKTSPSKPRINPKPKTTKGTLLFRGAHGTKVLINGKLVGVLPMKQLTLEDGKYLISFQGAKNTTHKPITVESGKTQYVSAQ